MLCYVMLCCHAIVDDVGDHLMPEQSVLWSPDAVCRAHFVLPACRNSVYKLQSLTPSRSPPSTLPVTTKWSRLCFLITCSQRNQVAVDGLYSIACAVHLLGCLSFRSMISITSSAKTTFQQAPTHPSSFLKSSNFHVHAAKLTIHNNTELITLSTNWFCGS